MSPDARRCAPYRDDARLIATVRADARPVTENGRIFAFENGREVATLGFVFTRCLRSAFALPSLPEAKKE